MRYHSGDQRPRQDTDLGLVLQLGVAGEARPAMKNATMKPIPATAETPSGLESGADPGIGASPAFTATQVDAKMPMIQHRSGSPARSMKASSRWILSCVYDHGLPAAWPHG